MNILSQKMNILRRIIIKSIPILKGFEKKKVTKVLPFLIFLKEEGD
jgi:hypothetical protein